MGGNVTNWGENRCSTRFTGIMISLARWPLIVTVSDSHGNELHYPLQADLDLSAALPFESSESPWHGAGRTVRPSHWQWVLLVT